jgi:hypothetical protein
VKFNLPLTNICSLFHYETIGSYQLGRKHTTRVLTIPKHSISFVPHFA